MVIAVKLLMIRVIITIRIIRFVKGVVVVVEALIRSCGPPPHTWGRGRGRGEGGWGNNMLLIDAWCWCCMMPVCSWCEKSVFFSPAQAIFACVFWAVLENSLKGPLVFSRKHPLFFLSTLILILIGATEGEPQALRPLAPGLPTPSRYITDWGWELCCN